MKTTKLFDYLLAEAERLKSEDGRKNVSSNYLVLAMLDVARKMENNSLPAELSDKGTLAELNGVLNLLENAGYTNKGKAATAIRKAVTADGYSAFMDDLVFKKIMTNATGKAEKENTPVSAELVIELALAEPTKAMRSATSDADTKNTSLKKPSGEGIDIQLKKPTDTVSEATPKRGDAPTAEADEGRKTEIVEEPSGVARLARVVADTQRIQSELLEVVYGQDQAINSFVSGYFQSELMSFSRADSKKPQAMFLFAGPPGVGKTFLAETAAKSLGLPFCRFDMSEYSDKEANFEFCGSDKVYKNAKAGNVTSFVAENPHCVLLFDEVEKAHLNVIHLFLQLLDAGRLRDNFTDEEVSFTRAILIFTTNAGKNLYEDPTVTNLSSISRKKVLKALSTDLHPLTGAPLFPAAICSRFASGNVIMFNHLGASNLHRIVKSELGKNISTFAESTGIKIETDDKISSAILFSEGGKADARTVKGRANGFFHEELYELFRLLDANGASVSDLKKIKVNASLKGASADIVKMFGGKEKPEVLIFAEDKMASPCKKKLSGIVCHTASRIEDAKEILFNHDIALILCDVTCRAEKTEKKLLNAEDMESVGIDFLSYVLERYSIPVHIIEKNDGDINGQEFLSFAKLGASDLLAVSSASFGKTVLEWCNAASQQANMLKLARENKVISYKTAQMLSADKSEAEISLFNFTMSLATDIEDSGSVLDNVSKPSVRFDDVIGAGDAKDELKYFVEYLKDPIKYMRKGVKAPKGVLLYDPPGTGKTMLAKAMAGESDVTFLTAEGNQFLKKYVGEGAEAVHKLFNAARKYAPSILFIDEIDAIAKDRKTSGQGDAVGDILTAFLTEMDGFKTDTSKPVFVLAATNYDVEPGGSRSLDAALLRRFDRRIYIDLPNKAERKRYIEMKMSQNSIIQISAEQIENIAIRSTGMSLAELESIFEMALRTAIRSNDNAVGDAAFEEAFETFSSGEKKEWSPELLERTARHEAGHALLCWISGEKPSYLTVVARGNHGGYMQHGDTEGKAIRTREDMLARIRTSLAGRAAEMVYYGDEGISTGASGDLDNATRVATNMICYYGMDEKLGLACIEPDKAGAYYETVHNRINEILAHELESTIATIEKNKAAIDATVKVLLEQNHLKGNEIDAIFTKTVKK